MSNDSQPAPLWEYIRIGDFRPPAEPAGESVRKGFSALWKRLTSLQSNESTENVQENLEEAGRETLGQLAPDPTWESAAAALGDLLEEGRSSVVVGTPWDGTSQTVRRLAVDRGWDLLEAPAFAELLQNDAETLHRVEWEGAEPLAIPRLEGFFLRQFDGLDLLRRLVERLLDSERPHVVGCGSWAWAFLCKSHRIDDSLTTPWVLKAFEAEKLGRWFRALAEKAWGTDIEFRMADSGEPVLPMAGDDGSESEPGYFLRRIAAHSRGHPGLAIEFWRRSLRISPSEDPDDARQGQRTPNAVWLGKWSDLNLPEVAGSRPGDEKFLLHALLLHDGLCRDALEHALQLGPGALSTTLAALRGRGLIEHREGIWRVSAAAYPSVRGWLKNEDLLTDSL